MENVISLLSDTEWLRTVFAVVVGGLLGAGGSMLTQWRASVAARRRQTRQQLATHCDALIREILRYPAPPNERVPVDEVYAADLVAHGEWSFSIQQACARVSMWLNDRDAGLIELLEIHSTLADERLTRAMHWRNSDSPEPRSTTVHLIAFSTYVGDLVSALVDLPTTDEGAIFKQLYAARQTFVADLSQDHSPLG